MKLWMILFTLICALSAGAAVDGWTPSGSAEIADGRAVLTNSRQRPFAALERTVAIDDEYVRAYRLTGVFEADAGDRGDLWLYCDIYYKDGTHTWGPYVTVDRQGSCVRSLDIIPTRPVRNLYLLALFRDSEGSVTVRDLSLKELSAGPERFGCRREGSMLKVWCRTPYPCRMALRREGREYVSDGTEHAFLLPGSRAEVLVNGRSLGSRTFAPSRGLRLWTEDSFARVFPDTPEGKGRPCLRAPRGGRVSFQLCARSDRAENLVLLSSDAVSDRGRISRSNVSLRAVRYNLLSRPENMELRDGEHLIAMEKPLEGPLPGLWGDALTPVSSASLAPDRTAAFWVTVKVPRDALPGEYSGSIKAGGRTVSYRLRVYSVLLPEKTGLRTSFSFVERWARKLQGDSYSYRKARAFLEEYGLDCHDIGDCGAGAALRPHTGVFPLTNAAEEENGAYTLWNSPERYGPRFEEAFAERIAGAYSYLQKQGALDRAYVYGFDERGSDYYPAMTSLFGMIHRRFPGLKTLSTAVLPPEVCPYDMGIDACVAIDPDREQQQKQKAAGGEYWWYVCGAGRFAVENTLLSDRLLFWQLKAMGLDGFLYWALDFWDKEDNAVLPPGGGDILFDISGGFCHGDGRLIYPAEGGGYYSSPRFEQIAEGLEDYRLLELYEDKYGPGSADALTGLVCRGTKETAEDPRTWDEARKALLEGLEKR
ncbi:MAG: DUF4091 domain-containing protein [Abditibacteriota bacterium]|nr:DUF4091 domain-containing protein [Abditibacteriota bacterium]